jgi:2-dehydro-3-deoxyphosphogluconate aldolase/(4S)-4-hydroxy-2-oxoglutarate aldolase
MDHTKFYQTLLEDRLLPLFYHPDAEVAWRITQACMEGGVHLIEFTHRGPNAVEVFKYLRKQISSTSYGLGIGSVVDPQTAALYLALGVDFIVSPVLNPQIMELCHRRGIPHIPGAVTPTEILQASTWGAEIIKVFPADALGGPAYLHSLLAPMPWLKLLPTGGIVLDEKSIQAWILAGAVALGMGSDLIRKDRIAVGDYTSISQAVARGMQWAKLSHAKTHH